MKKWQYFCNVSFFFSWRRFSANTIKNNFHNFSLFVCVCVLHSSFFFSPYKNYKYFVFHFSFLYKTTNYTNQVRQNNSENGGRKQTKTHLCTLKQGRKKHSMFLPGPRTLICIEITQRFTKTLDVSLLCASLKLGLSAIEAQSLAATANKSHMDRTRR